MHEQTHKEEKVLHTSFAKKNDAFQRFTLPLEEAALD
jgi:hypothetical protein